MANVVNRTTVRFLRSVSTPDFPVADWIINPDLSSVAGVPTKYWKISGDLVLEMTQAEKDAVDAAEAAATLTGVRTEGKDIVDRENGISTNLRSLILILIDEFNILRTLHSLPDRTLSQLKTSIKNRIDAGDAD